MLRSIQQKRAGSGARTDGASQEVAPLRGEDVVRPRGPVDLRQPAAGRRLALRVLQFVVLVSHHGNEGRPCDFAGI